VSQRVSKRRGTGIVPVVMKLFPDKLDRLETSPISGVFCPTGRDWIFLRTFAGKCGKVRCRAHKSLVAWTSLALQNMAFIRNNNGNYCLVETYKEGDKPCQRILVYLGKYPTCKKALAGFKIEAAKRRKFCEQARAKGRKEWLKFEMRWLKVYELRIKKLQALAASGKLAKIKSEKH
jgi:hypothetical protein